MSSIDGTKDPLSYGEALVVVAQAAALGTQERVNEVVRAIQTEHNILPPDPDIQVDEDAELHDLRARKAAKDKADEKAALRAELGDDTPAVDPSGESAS